MWFVFLGKMGENAQRQLLTSGDINFLVEYCLYSTSHGFPLMKPQVLAHTLAIYNQRHPDTPKTVLGQTWWINFLWEASSHPDSLDSRHHRPWEDILHSEGPIEDYFRLLTATLVEHGLREKPRKIYNYNETGFQLDSARRHAIVPQGTKLA